MKINSLADEIVVAGAALNENINVTDIHGYSIKSIKTNCNVMNIKLPKHQVYIVNIGKARYKVAL